MMSDHHGSKHFYSVFFALHCYLVFKERIMIESIEPSKLTRQRRLSHLNVCSISCLASAPQKCYRIFFVRCGCYRSFPVLATSETSFILRTISQHQFGYRLTVFPLSPADSVQSVRRWAVASAFRFP